MAEHKAVEVTKEQIQEAENLWHHFTVGMKYATYATCIILVLLALAFVKFT